MEDARGPAAPRRIPGGWAAFALIVAAGLWVSLHYALGTWKADPDIFVTVELWRGLHRHGLRFAASWAYTQDNWLLSVIPLAALLYEALGATARTAVLLGWLFFAASVGLTAWLVAKTSGWRAAAVTACVLLFANVEAVGDIGFLTYPISHNSSMTWGLTALLLGYFGLERRSFALSLAAGLAVLAAAVSDPWATAGIAAPLILSASAIAVMNRQSRRGGCALALAAASGVAVWIAHRHPHGLFGFLLADYFQRGTAATALENLVLAFRALGAMFNIIPGARPDAVLPQAVAVAALAAVVGGSALFLLTQLRQASAGRQLVTGAAILSLGTILGLYMAAPPNTDLHVGRFFPNVYFLGAVLVAMAASEGWARWPRPFRWVTIAYAALLAISGLASAPRLWIGPLPDSAPPEAIELGRFLQANGLSYGYGGFWGSRALTMETLTGGAVTIRPVSLLTGRITRRRQETSAYWYRPEAEPKGRPLFLFLIGDGEECAQLAACDEIARRQFGEPSRVIPYNGGEVLVWNHPLAPLIDPMPK